MDPVILVAIVGALILLSAVMAHDERRAHREAVERRAKQHARTLPGVNPRLRKRSDL